MKVTRIAAAIALATAMTGAFAATPTGDLASDQVATSTARKWYQAGDRVLQIEQEQAKLAREGFSAY